MKCQISPSQKPVFCKLLPFELKNRNDGRGHKYYRAKKDRDHFERVLRLMKAERDPFGFPVILHLTRILGARQQLVDEDSLLRGNAKELIDALVAVGWFKDDNPASIVSAQGFQINYHREAGPATFVEVYRWDECQTIPSNLDDWLNGTSSISSNPIG
jgi:hypothetical protein